MANTPYYTKAESDAISEFIKKSFESGIVGTVTPNVGGIPQIDGVDITQNGYYFVSASGDYGTIIGIDINNNFVILEVRDIETTAVYSKIDIPLNIVIDAVPTDGSTNAVQSGGVVTYISDLFTNQIGNNIAFTSNIINDKYIVNDTGVLDDAVGFKVMKIPNLTEGQKISFGNFQIANRGNYSWYNNDTLVSYGGSYNNTADLPIENLTVPAGVNILYFLICRSDSSPTDYDEVMVNIGITLLSYEVAYNYVLSINSDKIIATSLTNDNVVPTPTTDENGVNRKYLEDNYTNTTVLDTDFVSQTEFDTNGIKVSDLTIDLSLNLARTENILNDTFVANTTGLLTSAVGFKTMVIPNLTPAQKISFGNFVIANNGNYSWYNNNTLVSFGGAFANTSALPIENLTVPAGVNKLVFTILRSDGASADISKIMANIGTTLLPYEVPIDYVTAIKNYEIAGSVGNVALQNTDVSFTSVTANALNLDLPSGATEPAGLEIGDAWVDTDDSTIKVKLI